MRLAVWGALARGVVLESVRRKDLWVVAILGFVIMLCAGALGFFGAKGLQVFVKDLAVTVLGLFSTVVAILTTCRLMPEEVKNRTLYPLLARPIDRFDLLFGKFVGAVLVSWIAFFALALLTSLALLNFGVRFDLLMAQYVLGKMMGLVVVCAVSFALSLFMTPSAAATLSLILAFGSTMIVRGLVMGYEQASPALQPLFRILNAALPQYGLFDFGGRAANIDWGPVPAWVLGALFAYMVAYSAAMLVIGWAKFRRQAI